MFYFDTWCEKYIAQLFPGFVRHIPSQSAVRFVRRIVVEGGPLRVKQEFCIVLSPAVRQTLHTASAERAAEIGRQACACLYRDLCAKMPFDEVSESSMRLYLDEEVLAR